MLTLISIGAGLLVTSYVVMFHQLLNLVGDEEETSYEAYCEEIKKL